MDIYGHLMYSIKKTDDYIEILKEICKKYQSKR